METWWSLVEQAREQAADPADAEDVAERTKALLMGLPVAELLALAQPLWELRARSYVWDLWQAADLLNGGCSDDGFEYFRGWLLTRGRAVFDAAVADPDTLADLPAVRSAAVDLTDFECESMYGVVWDAYHELTGAEELPVPLAGRYPALEKTWDGDVELRRRLPRLAALYLDDE